MVRIYEHQKPDERVIDWAKARREEIKEEIRRLQTEDKMVAHILKQFQPLVCDYCDGEGAGLFGGDNVDGPRMATCPKCKGTGKPSRGAPPTGADRG